LLNAGPADLLSHRRIFRRSPGAPRLLRSQLSYPAHDTPKSPRRTTTVLVVRATLPANTVIARSESDEAIHASVCRAIDCARLRSLSYGGQVAARATTESKSRYGFAFPRRETPGGMLQNLPSPTKGAGNAGCALHPRSRVQNCAKKRTRAYRFSGGNPAFPAQLVLTAYAVLSPATNSSCHRHRRIEGFSRPVGPIKTSADLTPATGVRTTRFCRPRTISAKRLSAGCAHPPKRWRDRSSIVRPARSSVAHG
jgi:hypothetical protein